jgi:hypothetical protein
VIRPGPRRPRSARARRSGRRSTTAALAVQGLGLLLALVPWPTPWVERAFARGLFPLASRVLAPVVGAVPFSLTLALAGALLATVALSLATASARRFLTRQLLPWTGAVLLAGFMLVWGLAYRRDTLAQLLALPTSPPTAAEVNLARDRLLAVNRATVTSAEPGPAAVAAAGRCVEREVARLTGAHVRVPGRVKLLPAGTLLRLGFAGVTSPWLLEPHVDAGLPPVTRLATAAHELTHTAGFAREADTDALAVLSGLECRDPAVRYAVSLHALALLLASEPPARRDPLLAALPARSLAALQAASRASARYRVPWLQRAATTAYGTYLRSRGEAGGMASYGRAISLVVHALARGGA